ncbi:hypothetical protein GCM10027568_14710 [Humibacter soli]
MDAAVFVTMLLTLVVVAAIVFTLPSLMPRTVPLGVNVPAAHIDEPIIRTSLRRFRLLVGASWLLAVILLVILVFIAPLAAALVSMLLFIAGSTIAYIVARQGIVRAKHEGKWYSGATVRLAGNVTAEPVRTPIPVGWFAVSMLLLGLVTVIGAAVYPTLPASIPVHWGATGVADRYEPKSVWAVFGQLIIIAIVVVGLFAVSFVGRIVSIRAIPSASAEQNAARERGIRSVMSSLLGWMMFAITLGLCWLTLVSWFLPSDRVLITLGVVVLLVMLFGGIVVFIVRWRRAAGRGAAITGGDTGADAPDDDRFWKAGILYVNRDDPAIMVPRRFGAGWTMNLGHPAGIAIGVVLLLIIVGALIFAFTARANR